MSNQYKKQYQRPTFPKRAVITAGMPYGNKELHFGHVGGLFVHADVFARFMRDRLGEENVIFASGTDCYGSPIVATYNQKIKDGEFSGSMEDFVMHNHVQQKKTFDLYNISLDLFAASAFGDAGKIHEEVSADFFEKLYENGFMKKMDTYQFFDVKKNVFLNGRQVLGRCPFPGCQSEKAYADECGLGHPYNPEELINPISIVSGEKPELRITSNWYFDLPAFSEHLQEMVAWRRESSNFRKYSLSTIEEFLNKPLIYVQKSIVENPEEFDDMIENFEIIQSKAKSSHTLMFETLELREKACIDFDAKQIRYRKGKTLVPFRLSGNSEWGVPFPEKEGLKDMTFWVWPESLFSPISFTKAYLKSQNKDSNEWKKYWQSEDAQVYQFIGEDNIYFYGVAQMAMFMGYNSSEPKVISDNGELMLTNIIANNFLLYMGKKTSSSSDEKPPMAHEMLDYYTKEQLRMHFISLGLAKKSSSFKPMAVVGSDEFDPVVKEGNLLTNVLNRLIRSCFYTSQQYELGSIPNCEISPEILELSQKAIINYERHMVRYDFHQLTNVLDAYIRKASKHWSKNIKLAENDKNIEMVKQVLADCFHVIKISTTLLHPLVPDGTERIREYLQVDKSIYNWDCIFDPISCILPEDHKLKFLEPRVDFFEKHESQLKR